MIGLSDGDTITVLDASNVRHKIRLAGIDAPERKQAFGNVSKQHLAALVFRKHVTVEGKKLDRYGRTVGKVYLGERDVCLEQIRAGLALVVREVPKRPNGRGSLELPRGRVDRESAAYRSMDRS